MTMITGNLHIFNTQIAK